MRESRPFILLVIAVCLLSTLVFYNTKNNTEKIDYCRIDSLESMGFNEVTPETKLMYWTDCGIKFSSKKQYQIGDSVERLTIIK